MNWNNTKGLWVLWGRTFVVTVGKEEILDWYGTYSFGEFG